MGETEGRPTVDREADVVSFTQMKDGTAEDYALLGRIEAQEMQGFPDRVLGWLRTMDDSAGYQVSRLDHSLQAATRAHRAGEDEETVVCVLLHDIGDYLAPGNHSEAAAAVLRPYVSEKNYWIVKHHGVFQGYYYFHHLGLDPNERERWRTIPTTRRRSTSARTTTRTRSTLTTSGSRSPSSSPWCAASSMKAGAPAPPDPQSATCSSAVRPLPDDRCRIRRGRRSWGW